MKLGLLFWTLAFIFASEISALKCYTCLDENNTPCTSLIETCVIGANVCLKAESEGVTIRGCGYADSLSHCSSLDSTSCCTTDLCNGSSRTCSSSNLMIMMVLVVMAMIYKQMF